MPMDPISSTQNPLIKHVTKLKLQKKYRSQHQAFYIEGFREIDLALTHHKRIKTLLHCTASRSLLAIDRFRATHDLSNIDIVCVSNEIFEHVSYRGIAAEVAAVVCQWHLPLSELKLEDCPLLVVVQGVEKPGNLGAILRTSDAVKADAVILCESLVDQFNPNVGRSSLGAIFSVPVIQTSTLDLIAFCEKATISMILTTPIADEVYSDIDLTTPIAVILGSESKGASSIWQENCSRLQQVRLPMLGGCDSLNLSCSAAIILYEILRQRSLL